MNFTKLFLALLILATVFHVVKNPEDNFFSKWLVKLQPSSQDSSKEEGPDSPTNLTLKLKSGESAVGSLVEIENDKLILDWKGEKTIFYRDEIDSIEELDAKKEKAAVEEEVVDKDTVVLYLADGGAIEGKLVRETKGEYVLLWQGGEVTFSADEVDRVSRGETLGEETGVRVAPAEINTETWDYKSDYVIYLRNGTLMDARIINVDGNIVTTEELLEGGGSIEQEITRDRIEHLLFKPVKNKQSDEIKKDLRMQFPNMQFFTEGNVTILTDSYITWVRKYRASLREINTELYLAFFEVLKDKKPTVQNFVVIFDDLIDYIEYAATDGIPGDFVSGYYKPDDKVLFLSNMLGDSISEFIHSIFVDYIGSQIDMATETIKRSVDKSYHLQIEAMSEEQKSRFWRFHDMIAGELRRDTFEILRHEFTHEVFSTWGVQGIILSSPKVDKEKIIKEKVDFLQTDDPKEKKKVLENLMRLNKYDEPFEIDAANSWYAEGLATYAETIPFGSEKSRWVYTVQKLMREDAVIPFEQLSVYRMGSFPGVFPESMIEAYAQSWAFVTFLMKNYPKEFQSYMIKMAEGGAEGDQDYEWLLEALGKDLRQLEVEFAQFLQGLPEAEDPFFERWEKVKDIFTSF